MTGLACSPSLYLFHTAYHTAATVRDALAVLREREMVSQVTNEEDLHGILARERVTVYCGFDPTADSLHLGNLVQLMALAHFQRAGHRPLVVVGGATGCIGDPSGRRSERPLRTHEEVAHNATALAREVERILDGVRVVDNRTWMEGVSALEFLSGVGRHFRVNNLLAKESVRTRMEGAHAGLSVAEFSYPLFQAFDFAHLYKTEACRVQIGGSDQWGNMTAGCDFVRRTTGEVVYGVTLPLLTTETGEKLGKSMGNAVWINAARTSPFALYQHLLQTQDADLPRLLRFLTFLPVQEIKKIIAAHTQTPERREGQRYLARDLTRRLHGEESLRSAETMTDALFGSQSIALHEVAELRAETILAALDLEEDVPYVELARRAVVGCTVVSVATETGLCESNSQARRLVRDGGLYVNNMRMRVGDTIRSTWLIGGSVLVVGAGKKRRIVVRVSGS